MHKAKIGHGYGVSARTNYALDRIWSLDSVADNLVPEPKCLQQMPFRAPKQPGYAYETLLIEPPIFLARLHHGLRSLRHVKFVKREFVGEAAVLKLPEPVIVNCTGLGTRNIWADYKLYPVKGHLVLLRPQPRLKYLFSGRSCVPWFQYVFPRQDAVVLGGTYQRYVEDEDPSQDTCENCWLSWRACSMATCRPRAPIFHRCCEGVENQNVTVEYHWLEGQFDCLPALMTDLVRRRSAATRSRSRSTPGSRHWRRHRRRAGPPRLQSRRWSRRPLPRCFMRPEATSPLFRDYDDTRVLVPVESR